MHLHGGCHPPLQVLFDDFFGHFLEHFGIFGFAGPPVLVEQFKRAQAADGLVGRQADAGLDLRTFN